MDLLLPFLTADFLGKPAWVWLSFVGIVIALIFSFFAIPRQYPHRVLFSGILGVIVLCAIMIGLGAAQVNQFSWVLYLFGAFLIFTGIRMWIIAHYMPDIANNPLLKFLKRHMRVTDRLRGSAFWVRETDPKTGKLERFATPLFLAFVLVSLWKTGGQSAAGGAA